MPLWLRGITRLARFLAVTFGEYNKDQGFVRSAGMAYTSLIALVPALAIVLAALAIFDRSRELLDRVQVFLIENMVPALSDTIIEHLDKFITNVDKVGIAGTIALVAITILLFDSIEQTFNHVFRVRKKRSFVRKLMAFTSVIVWGPALIGLSIWLTRAMGQLVRLDLVADSLAARIGYFAMPLVMTWIAFLLAFLVIPATRVRLSSAAIGAAISALLWEIAKVAFAVYVPKAVAYSTIYGSLAAIPLFLIWMYYTWLIVLFGLEVTYVHQHYEGLLFSRLHGKTPTGRRRILVALHLFATVARRYRDGKGAVSLEKLATDLGIPLETAAELADALTAQGLLIESDAAAESYVPGRSLDRITVAQVIGAVYADGRTVPEDADGEPGDLERLLSEVEGAALASLDGKHFDRIIEEK